MKAKTKNPKYKKGDRVEVKMVFPSGKENATRMYKQTIENFGTLGREIKISPKANIMVNEPGFKTEFYTQTVNVLIGIGNDHTADLIMTKDAYSALKRGDKITITTTKQFKKNFL